ncbi:MAG: rRNA maturation RNase YbeY [Clostridia bacterium]|nr:rRNA maturation RNase YbeY [Clostridia bacterium]
MKVKVVFSNNQKHLKITTEIKSMLRDVIKRTLVSEDFGNDAEVSLSFVDNEEIHRLNKEFRGIDRPTDVLSFPMLDGDDDTGDFDMYVDSLVLGDIIISVEKAIAQASEYGHSIERELAFLTVHSTLHLLGYDHETGPEDEHIMFDKQDKILESAGIIR